MIRLKKKIPRLRNFDRLAKKSRQKLKPYYEQYISKVSTDIMTISLDLSVFLTVILWSIDDSKEWLEKTRTFLASHNIPSDNLIIWRSFVEQNYDTFDLILHDLGSMEVRKEMLKEVLTLSHPGGIIVLDDIHKQNYRSYTKRLLNESNLNYYNLKFFTRDKFGRYSMLVTL